MAASTSDLFTYVAYGTLTNLASPGYTTGNSSINVDDASAWPTLTAVYFSIDTVDSNGLRVDGSYTSWKGIVSGNTIGSLELQDGDDQDYPAGSSTRVMILDSAALWNALIDGLSEEHNKNGTHSDVTATSVTSTGNLTTSGAVSTDTVSEKTSGHGVTIDGLNIKDSYVVGGSGSGVGVSSLDTSTFPASTSTTGSTFTGLSSTTTLVSANYDFVNGKKYHIFYEDMYSEPSASTGTVWLLNIQVNSVTVDNGMRLETGTQNGHHHAVLYTAAATATYSVAAVASKVTGSGTLAGEKPSITILPLIN